MDNQNNNNSNSDIIIDPENNYKFDNYGIVMADSIEDLLYDKYNYKKNKLKHNNNDNDNDNNPIDNSSEKNVKDSNNSNNSNNKSITIDNNKSITIDNNKSITIDNNKSLNKISMSNSKIDSELNERKNIHNINDEESESTPKNINISKPESNDNKENQNNLINGKNIKEECNNNNNVNDKINNKDNKKDNEKNFQNLKIHLSKEINYEIKSNKKNNSNSNNNNNLRNKLKMIRCKGFQIKNNNYINKEKEKEEKEKEEKEKKEKEKENNKTIKIILNINNKEKKEVEINPNESNIIKNISINSNILNKKEDINNNNNNNNPINNNINNNNIDNQNEENIKSIKSIKSNTIYDSNSDNINDDNYKKNKILNKNNYINEKDNNNNMIKMTKMFLKKKEFEKNIKNGRHIKDNNKNIKKIHLISTNELNNKNNKKEKYKDKKKIFHNVPISSQCYIVKLRKSRDLYFNKIIPKKERIFITKLYTQRKKDKDKDNNYKIISLPSLSNCYFVKDKKIIYVRSHISLQNVINNNYFCTKERVNITEKQNKVYERKLKHKKKSDIADIIDNNLDLDENKSSDEQEYNKNINKNDNTYTELDIEKYNSPNIIIKIINPLNSSYKFGKIDIKTNSPSNITKSKSCQKIINNNKDDKISPNRKSYLFNIIKDNNKDRDNNKNIFRMSNKKKIKKIKNLNNNRYEIKKESTDFHCLKNKELINALNNSTKYKLNCPACMTINKRKKLEENIYRNVRLKNKNISKSEKNFKIKPYNIHNSIKNKLINSEDEKIQRNKIKQYNHKDIKNHLFPQANKIINDKRNINLKQQINVSYNSMNKIPNFTHIEFPAIDSYFH